MAPTKPTKPMKTEKRKQTKKDSKVAKSFQSKELDMEKEKVEPIGQAEKEEKEVEMNAEKEVEMIKFEDFKVENEKSDDEDESGKGDNEDGQNEMEKIHVKIQSKASKKAELKEKKGSKKSSSDEAKGDVVYLGRIPHGFYEEEMKAYFSQFGEILNLRLSRNKKTGASKHYAFIKFANPAVAEIVVETMHNYLLSNRLLQCHLLDKDQIHSNLFNGAGTTYKPLPWNKMERERHHKLKTPEEFQKHVSRVTKKRSKKFGLLKSLGIDFDPNQDDGVPAKSENEDKKAIKQEVVLEKKVQEMAEIVDKKVTKISAASKKTKGKSGKVSKRVKSA